MWMSRDGRMNGSERNAFVDNFIEYMHCPCVFACVCM